MMSMVCQRMNRKATKTKASMVTKEVSQIFKDLVISGVDRTKVKVASRVFSEILKIFLEVRNLRNLIGLQGEKTQSFIWNLVSKNPLKEQKGVFHLRSWINVRLAKDQNASQAHSLKNVKLVKEKEQSILDKDLCKFRWDVPHVAERVHTIAILV